MTSTMKSQRPTTTAGKRFTASHRPGHTRADVGVGKLLTAAREQRRLSLEAISAELNIPVAQLQGLEQGDVSVFAAEVYARGAFARYAEHLGIQAEAADHAFMRVLSGAREFVPLKVHTPRPWLQAVMTPRWVLAGVLLGVAVLLGGYLAWQVGSFFRLPALAVLEPAAGVIEAQTIVVHGTAATDAEVASNGQPVPLAADGTYSFDLPLHHGINRIEVSATNAAGRTRIISRDLLVPRT